MSEKKEIFADGIGQIHFVGDAGVRAESPYPAEGVVRRLEFFLFRDGGDRLYADPAGMAREHFGRGAASGAACGAADVLRGVPPGGGATEFGGQGGGDELDAGGLP